MKRQIIKKYFTDKSAFKFWLKRSGFRPECSNWRDALKYGVFIRGNRLYRFRSCNWQGSIDSIQVDISCVIENFDRWANSTDCYSIELKEFMCNTLDQLLTSYTED